jgi:DNA-3-methyladenine glycosylase I
MQISLTEHQDKKHRCSWCGEGASFSDYIHYHDHEWGVPNKDERYLFEKICLEGFQAGLSWITVLRKRERFRQVFANFDYQKLALFSPKQVDALMLDTGIIRHRGKIDSAINNAKLVRQLFDEKGEGALARLVWQFEAPEKSRPKKMTPAVAAAMTQSKESEALSKLLRKMGFSFVGPTTMYAFIQSVGLVNDHLEGCHRRITCETLRSQFVRPL